MLILVQEEPSLQDLQLHELILPGLINLCNLALGCGHLDFHVAQAQLQRPYLSLDFPAFCHLGVV